MLDDMLDTLGESLLHSQIEMKPPVHGLTKISVNISKEQRKVKKEEKNEIHAIVYYYCGPDSRHGGYDHPSSFEKTFGFDRAGLKDAICFVQRQVQNVKRRGLCKTCLEDERPMKRLRVGDTDLCGSCLLQKAIF